MFGYDLLQSIFIKGWCLYVSEPSIPKSSILGGDGYLYLLLGPILLVRFSELRLKSTNFEVYKWLG